MSWQETIRRILESETIDLVELANLSGFPPNRFYVGANLSGVDLRGQDLSGIDFTNASLSGALFDKKTVIDPEFDPRVQETSTRRSLLIPYNLYLCVRLYEETVGYSYTGWAIKNLLDKAFREIKQGRAEEWISVAKRSKSVESMLSQNGHKRFDLKLNTVQYKEIVGAYHTLGSSSKSMRLAILSGVMRNWNIKPELVGEATSVYDILLHLPLHNRAKKFLEVYGSHWRE